MVYKHGKENKKSGLPLNFDTILVYSKESSLNAIQNVIPRPWSFPMGLNQVWDKFHDQLVLQTYIWSGS